MPDLWLLGLALPWGWAIALALWPRRYEPQAPVLALAGAALTVLVLAVGLALGPPTGAIQTVASTPGVPELGLGVVWIRDGLSAMFAILTAWVAALVTLFSWRYMPRAQALAGSRRSPRSFYALLSAFTGAMLGLVASGGLLQLYFFWELTSLASFLLIGFWHHKPEARRGALHSLVLTTAGSLAMAVGLVALGGATGAWDFPALLAGRGDWRAEAWLGPVTALILVGALAKSAQLPFSSWLPDAMAAPTPVSAFLHSSALVAAGVYLLARFFPLVSHVPVWGLLLLSSGILGGLSAGLMALRQPEVKALLAFSTVSQYAFIFIAFGLGTAAGAQAGLYAFFIHALIKAGLFLVAGAVTHLTGEKRLDGLGGLARSNPVLALLAVSVALSLGGVPIFGGFYYKEELLHAAYEQEAWLLLAATLVGGMLTFLYMLRFLREVFLGAAPAPRPRSRLPGSMGAAIALLAGASVLTGVFPNWPNAALLNPAISSVLQTPTTFAVELHAGGVLVLSLGVLALGAGIDALWSRGRIPLAWLEALPVHFALGGRRALEAYGALSERLLDLQGGNLRRYLRVELVAVLSLLVLLWSPLSWPDARLSGGFDLPVTVMLGLALLAAFATVYLRRHVLAILALTISGYALAVVFALMHAPDVALAQVLVETLATFSIVLALRQSRLIHPQRTRILTAGKRDWGRWGIALGVGGAVGWLTFYVGRRIPPDPVGAWYAERAYGLTGMHDLVTAILTDFRALDTAIEILVFASAAFAVMGLFRHREHGHE